MSDLIRVPVTPYVWHFIKSRYGLGKNTYHLKAKRHHDLMIAFQGLGFKATLIPQPQRLPGKHIYISTDGDRYLQELAQENEVWLKAGAFFQHEFNTRLANHVESQRQLAQRMGLRENQWNARLALEDFMSMYGIHQEMYSYESLRRQWTRLNEAEKGALEQKLYTIFKFSTQPGARFKPCSLHVGKNTRVLFYAQSRSYGKVLVRHQYKVPQFLLKPENSDLFHDHVHTVFAFINKQLKKGVTVR